MTSPDVTVIQSSPDLPIGSLGDQLTSAGLRVRTVRADLGEALPARAELGAGLIVLDGWLSAYDDEAAPWLPELRELLLEAATDGVPTLAIGLGAQLLAVAGGGQVTLAAPPGPETGAVRVFWRPEALTDPLVAEVARSVAEAGERASLVPSMHIDAVTELPEGAVWLASSNMYPFQVFRLGSAVGTQFHVEVSAGQLSTWLLTGDDADLGADDSAERMASNGRAVAAGLIAAVRAAGALSSPTPR